MTRSLPSPPDSAPPKPPSPPVARGRWQLVVVSRALLHGAYRRKAELLAAEPDIDLTVVVPTVWREGGRLLRGESGSHLGYRQIAVPLHLTGHFHTHFYRRLDVILQEIGPTLVHIDEEPYNVATWLAVRAARRSGAKSLFFSWQNLRRMYPPPFAWFERDVFRRVAGAIAGSETAAQVLRSKGYRGPLAVIPQFGVDARIFRPAMGSPHTGPLSIGYVGRLVWAKGVDLLIAAAARLRIPWQLFIVGTGPAQPALRHMASELGVSDRLCWLGWLTGGDLAEQYRRLDVLVLPSRSTRSWVEQFGRVLIEAMASGVACVGARSGEIPYVLADAGLLFDEGDVDELASCLERLASQPDLRRTLAETGYRRAMERFTMERIVADSADFYRSLIFPSAVAEETGP